MFPTELRSNSSLVKILLIHEPKGIANFRLSEKRTASGEALAAFPVNADHIIGGHINGLFERQTM